MIERWINDFEEESESPDRSATFGTHTALSTMTEQKKNRICILMLAEWTIIDREQLINYKLVWLTVFSLLWTRFIWEILVELIDVPTEELARERVEKIINLHNKWDLCDFIEKTSRVSRSQVHS